MLVLVYCVFAKTLGVPDLDLLVKTTSHDLSIVVGDGNSKNISLVANKLLHGLAGGNVPEAD